MLLKFFKRPLPTVFSAIVIIAILIWFRTFVGIDSLSFYFDEKGMPFYELLLRLAGGNRFFENLLALTALLLTAFYLIQLNTKHILIKYRTYLPTLLYILLSSSFLPLQRVNPAVFSIFFIVLAIDKLYGSYDKSEKLDNIFMAGFYVAIASLFYFNASLYLVLVIISLIVLKSIGVKEVLVTLFGFLTPWFFLFFYHFFFYDNLQYIPDVIFSALDTIGENRYYGVLFTILYSFTGLLLLIGLYYLLKVLPTQKISIRKFYVLLLWFVVLSIPIAFFTTNSSIEIIYFAAFPASFIISNYLTFARSRFWPEFYFTILFVVALLMQFY